MAVLRPGDWIGEMSQIHIKLHSTTVHAEIQTDVMSLARFDHPCCQPGREIQPSALMGVYGRAMNVLAKRGFIEAFDDGTTTRIKENKQAVP